MTKTQIFPVFKVFMHLVLKFRRFSWIELFPRVNKETVVCREVFKEEIIPMFSMKMSETDTGKSKHGLCGLEC